MTEGLIETLKGINDKIDYPLSNRVNLNLSKEQVDAIIFYLEKIAELERDKADLIYIRNANAKCMCEDKEYKEKAVALLKRVVEWADWQSGSKCPSFQDIEKDIKAFLEE